MKIFMPLAAGLLVAASAAAQEPDQEIVALFDSWAPLAVDHAGSDLVVILPQPRITLQIFHAVVGFGLCLAEPLDVDISEVGELVVLNQFGVQGFVFEGGAAGCEEVLSAPSNLSEIVIAGQSRGYSRF